jgi:hypothetical protein
VRPRVATITNPGRPCRGTVRATDDGAIIWSCRIRDCPSGIDGLDLTEIAATITKVISIARRHANCSPPPD